MAQQPTFDEAVQALQKHFGYPGFRPGQDHIVRTILSGRDTLAIMPTGGGKSICYQIPALLRDGLTIVVSPLISLMQDQVAALQRVNIPATYINSVIDVREAQARMEKAKNHWYKLMYVAPERFESRQFIASIVQTHVTMLAVDEAHCISEWGHDFRPSYQRLKEAIEQLGRPQVVALTATATPDVRLDIQQQLALVDPEIIVRGFNRENLAFRVLQGVNKREEILRRCEGPRCGIVYAGTRNNVEEIAGMLQRHGVAAEAYHAGLDSQDRAQVQERFMRGATRVIVATTAFGMGIDKSDVRFVLHHDMPSTIEQYYQEAGRAGRDGQASECVLMYHPKDRGLPEFFIRNTFPDKAVIQKVYAELHRIAGTQEGQVYTDLLTESASSVAARLGSISEAAVRGAFEVLEREGYIRRINDSWTNSAVRFLLGPDELRQWLIDGAEAMQQSVVIGLLRTVQSSAFGDEAEDLDMEKLMAALDIGASDLQSILRQLQRDRIIDYTPGQRGSGIVLLGQRVSAQHLHIDYTAIERRMQHQMEKLRAMEHYILGDTCRRNMILGYFGEKDVQDSCGTCDVCTGQLVRLVEDQSAAVLAEGQRFILHCVAETGGRFGRLVIADILRGAKSQRITQYNLHTAASYGRLKHFDRAVVLEAIDALLGLGWLGKTDSVRPSITLTEAGRAVLGYNVPAMELPSPEEASTVPVKDAALYQALRATRRRLAAQRNLPSHVLVPDRVLRELANRQPATREECLRIEGLGPVTFEKCGREMLATIHDHLHEQRMNAALRKDNSAVRQLSAQLRATWEAAGRGLSLADIAAERNLTEGTVSNQLSELIRRGVQLPMDALIPLVHQNDIRNALRSVRDSNIKRIKAVVRDEISYAEIRVMLALIDVERGGVGKETDASGTP